MINLKEVSEHLIKNDLYSFINKVFHTINPGIEYKPNSHIELISDYLTAVQKGEIKRLIINLPPRSLKSVCISVAWPAWLLGHDPTQRILAASYSQTLSIKHSLDCRFVLASDWYNRLFPKTILSKSHNQKSKFLTSVNGFRFATSVGGSVTGEGGDFLILDDPHNPIHVNSEKLRNKVIEWFEQTFLTRLNDKRKGAVIIVMQRLHSEDLTAHLLKNSSKWELLKIPSHFSVNLEYKVLNRKYNFKEGDFLHADRDNAEILKQLQQEVGISNYKAQYLQEPIENNCYLLKACDINFYDDLPCKFDYFIQSWDSAIQVSDNADYSVGICFGIIDKKYYVITMDRAKYTYPFLKSQVEKLARIYNPKYILIEDKASGQQLIQDLRFDNYPNIIAIKPKLDKITRFASVLTFFESGRLLLPKISSFKNIILEELTTFPNSKNDDIVDCISQFLNFIKEFSSRKDLRIREF